MSDVTLRLAVPEDSAELGRLAYQLVKLHHDFDPLRFIKIDDPNAPGYGRFLSSRANDPNAIVLVATVRDDVAEKIVGYTYATLEGKDWNDLRDAVGALNDILVAPEWRQKGIAKKLALETFSRLEALGAPRIVLKTAAKNLTAQRFFHSLGFRDTMIEMTRERGGDVTPGE